MPFTPLSLSIISCSRHEGERQCTLPRGINRLSLSSETAFLFISSCCFGAVAMLSSTARLTPLASILAAAPASVPSVHGVSPDT